MNISPLKLNINDLPGIRRLKKFLRSTKLDRYNERTGNRIMSRRVSLQAIQGTEIWIQPETVVDRYSSIGSYTFIGSRTSITVATIGRYCSIAENVTIGPGEHLRLGISTSAYFMEDPYKELTEKNCSIGHDVWIGVDSIIRRGVTVGNGAIIGANSFVNKDVPPFAIVAGSPARVIRYRFEADVRRRIESSAWWDLEQQVAKKTVRALELELGIVKS